MSYYFSVLLKDSIIFGVDRTFNNAETGESRSVEKRYSILGDNRVFLPTGNLPFCVGVQDLLHSFFEYDFDPFESGDFMFSELFSVDYEKIKRENINKLESIGKTGDSENVDCLYGGLKDNGTPFIMTVSSTDDFKLKFIDKPMQYVCLNQTPKVLTFVKGLLNNFIGATKGVETDVVWELGKRFLPQIIQKVSKVDPLVSASGDLIFVSNKEIQTYEF